MSRRLYEANKVTPDLFYEAVAKKTGVSKDIVKDIYMKYLGRVQEVARKDIKVMIKGLGTFQMNPNKSFGRLYAIDRLLDMYKEKFTLEETPDWMEVRLDQASGIIKNLNQLKKKYEFIERSMENFWSNSRRLKEFLDNKGHRRDYRGKANEHMQELSQ